MSKLNKDIASEFGYGDGTGYSSGSGD